MGVIDARTLTVLLLVAAIPVTARAETAAVDAEPPFRVISRVDDFEFFPCGECHEDMEPDATRRELSEAPHFPEVNHGDADVWCTTCHALDQREYLQTLSGERLEFDRAYLICAQCHNAAYRDWRHGAHGKRVRRWRGGREVYNCTGCHDPHEDPGIRPRKPQPPPGVRAGLQRQERKRAHGRRFWQPPTAEGEDSDVTQRP